MAEVAMPVAAASSPIFIAGSKKGLTFKLT